MANLFAAERYIVRARRLADLSQRDLATAIDVAPSTVARLECAGESVPTSVLACILALAGLRLAVLDEEGNEIEPFPADAVRDNAGRRFPAHLDVDPPDEVPTLRQLMPRNDRRPAKGWYRMREQRDLRREREGLPSDHTTEHDLIERQRQKRAERLRRQRILYRSSPPSPECQCITACWIGQACEPHCPCQCEPASRMPFRWEA